MDIAVFCSAFLLIFLIHTTTQQLSVTYSPTSPKSAFPVQNSSRNDTNEYVSQSEVLPKQHEQSEQLEQPQKEQQHRLQLEQNLKQQPQDGQQLQQINTTNTEPQRQLSQLQQQKNDHYQLVAENENPIQQPEEEQREQQLKQSVQQEQQVQEVEQVLQEQHIQQVQKKQPKQKRQEQQEDLLVQTNQLQEWKHTTNQQPDKDEKIQHQEVQGSGCPDLSRTSISQFDLPPSIYSPMVGIQTAMVLIALVVFFLLHIHCTQIIESVERCVTGQPYPSSADSTCDDDDNCSNRTDRDKNWIADKKRTLKNEARRSGSAQRKERKCGDVVINISPATSDGELSSSSELRMFLAQVRDDDDDIKSSKSETAAYKESDRLGSHKTAVRSNSYNL